MDAPKHYEELNCTGVKNRGDCCDSFYICPDSMYEHPLEKCQYLGKWYDINDKVDVSLLPSCISEAKCVSSSDGAKFQLVRESPVAIEDGCVAQYTLDNTCTPTKKVCGAAEKEKLHKCYHNKKMYHEGEVIKPTNFGPYFSTVCYKCLCDASYNNNTAPIMNENCRKIQCGMELLNADKFRDGCVPVYQKINVNDIEPTTCEPVDFMCRKSQSILILIKFLKMKSLEIIVGGVSVTFF